MKNSESSLETVAQHERGLLARIEEAKKRAGDILRAAETEAGTIARRSEAECAAAVSEIRQDGERACADARRTILEEAGNKAERMRGALGHRTDDVVREVIQLILPQAPEDGP